MSHTIYASFAKDYFGNIIHQGDLVDWQGHKHCIVREVKRGGNLSLLVPSLPFSCGVKSHNVTLEVKP